MREEERAAMVANADTFAGEAVDPAWADIDLDALSGISVPVLLTQGGQSPPMFMRVISRLAAAMDSADGRTLPEAGQVPHATHPAEYVAVIRRLAVS
jgi:pimeloyl-ACP methyl ester carboxylesterase